MDRCTSPVYCSTHSSEDWKHCVLCRTRVQAADSLKRAQARQVQWPVKPVNQVPPVKDLSSCTINEAIGTMVQYLGTSTRHCKKYYNGLSERRRNSFDRHHCSRFHVDQPESCGQRHRNPLVEAESMSISVAPGTYSITAGEWGGCQNQTHVVKLSSGQSANLDFVF
ncbi:uncharacterized protein [Watersipora subatra]|uniref:uncharacterized protein n=1 Tax=Watersipora subatra TaxID=2589382 RepID=UPI00355B7274